MYKYTIFLKIPNLQGVQRQYIVSGHFLLTTSIPQQGGNFMKKILTFLAAIMVLTASSCNNVKNPDDTDDQPQPTQAEVLSDPDQIKEELLQHTNCYKKESISLPDEIKHISTMQKLGDGTIVLLASGDKANSSGFYLTDESFTEFTLLEYEEPEEFTASDEAYSIPNFNFDGSFVTCVHLTDHGGVVAPDEYDENFDYESYNENAVYSDLICTYDKSGKLLTKAVINVPEELLDPYTGAFYLHSSIADGDSLIVAFDDGSIRRIDSAGNFTMLWQPADDGSQTYFSNATLSLDRDGKPICVIPTNAPVDNQNGFTVTESTKSYFDLVDGKPSGEALFTIEEYKLQYPVVFGYGEYRFIIPTNDANDGVIGVRDDGSTETVIDWSGSSLDPMCVIPIADDNFIGLSWNDPNGENIMKLVPKDMSELANVEVITVSNGDQTVINEFNNYQTKYHVKSIRYEDTDQLNLDIISGNAPDVICDMNYSTYLNYRKKGLFTDLYELMDDEMNKDSIMPNVITALESNGKLYSLCLNFNIETLVTKTRISDKENWTFDDMASLYDSYSGTAAHLYDSQSKLDTFKTMFYTMNDLIDYENATCDFDNPDFIKMLEFCNRFVDNVDMPSKFDEPEAFSKYHADKFHWFGNDQTIVEPLSFFNISQYNLIKFIQCDGEELTLAGYPSNNGKGGRIEPGGLISVNDSSSNKQGAWEFLKFFVKSSNKAPQPDEEYFYSDWLPVLTDTFNSVMKYELTAKHSSMSTSYPSYTQADIDMLSDYIISCDTIGTVLDEDICNICEEEAGIYFAGGQTAEATAEHIQNRVSILISERS